MLRRTPMRNTGFLGRRDPVDREARRQAHMTALLATRGRASVMGGTTSGQPIEKEDASQHQGYMDAVKALGYCMRCGCRFPAYVLPDFCHRNMGKGKGIKTDVRQGWPGCRPCHTLIDSGGLPREIRRIEELELGRLTRAAILAAGTWPARLPKWET